MGLRARGMHTLFYLSGGNISGLYRGSRKWNHQKQKSDTAER
jgi:hypothetical protein